MKKLISITILCVCFLAFYSCEKSPTIDIPLSSVKIELEDVLVSGDAKALNSFDVTQTITYEALIGLSEEAIKYKDRIENIKADSAAIIITTTDDEGTVVEEFVVKVDKLSDFVIEHYSLGTTYTNDKVEPYISQLLLQILLKESININISGKTDIASGEKLKVTLMLENITLVARLLE